MTYYETWDEYPGLATSLITVTDAPSGMRLVSADEYERMREVLKPLARIAQVYEDSGLDEHRPEWGYKDPKEVVLAQGRGGNELITLADAYIARATLNKIKSREAT